jgi:hypothetical protein
MSLHMSFPSMLCQRSFKALKNPTHSSLSYTVVFVLWVKFEYALFEIPPEMLNEAEIWCKRLDVRSQAKKAKKQRLNKVNLMKSHMSRRAGCFIDRLLVSGMLLIH